jgi:hypothetical protein
VQFGQSAVLQHSPARIATRSVAGVAIPNTPLGRIRGQPVRRSFGLSARSSVSELSRKADDEDENEAPREWRQKIFAKRDGEAPAGRQEQPLINLARLFVLVSSGGFAVKSFSFQHGLMNFARYLGSLATKILGFIGRHPTPLLVLPSLWLLLRYLPFWKDIDATVQLIAPAYDDNILHFPPVYSFLARVPFFVIDSLLHGHSPGVFERQHPSLAAVYGLVLIQQVGLWLALRYFILAFPARDIARGAITLLVASIASFYSFAYTCGSEAMTPITYFLVFGAGIRVLLKRATWRSWLIYSAALFLAIGSRHINLILLIWLPGTAVFLLLWSLLPLPKRSLDTASGSQRSLPKFQTTGRGLMLTVLIALLCSAVALGAEKIVLTTLCRELGVVERSSMGSAMSGRIATWVDQLSAEQKSVLLNSVQQFTGDPHVKQAIQFQLEIGSYDKGTGSALEAALKERGFDGEKMRAQKDQLISQSSLCFYRTFDTGLVKAILGDFWHGFIPTNDQGIAIAAPKATFFSLERIDQNPSDWVGVSDLPIFDPANAKATLARATQDNMVRHWRWMPILAWTLLFVGLGSWRWLRRALPGTHLIIGLSILAIGTLVYAANCICIYTLPRYALPLLVAVIAFGALVSAAEIEQRES